MPIFNRKQSPSGSTKTAVRLSNDTLEGLTRIKTLFRSRFPQESFPTLSACLDLALRRYLEEFGNNQVTLREEVAEFKARYEKEEPA